MPRSAARKVCGWSHSPDQAVPPQLLQYNSNTDNAQLWRSFLTELRRAGALLPPLTIVDIIGRISFLMLIVITIARFVSSLSFLPTYLV